MDSACLYTYVCLTFAPAATLRDFYIEGGGYIYKVARSINLIEKLYASVYYTRYYLAIHLNNVIFSRLRNIALRVQKVFESRRRECTISMLNDPRAGII